MAELKTREEESIKKQAIRNLPTPERYAKGDVEIHGLDDEEGKAAYPSAKVKRTADRVEKLLDGGTITQEQAKLCYFFRLCHYCATREYHCKVMSYDALRAGVGGWVEQTQALDYALAYLFLAERITTKASHILHGVVVHEKAPREVVRRRYAELHLHIREAVEELEKAKKDLDNYNKGLAGTVK